MGNVTHTEQSLDWLKVAKSAGKHGIRFRTNAALVAFLNEVATPAPDSEKLREAATELDRYTSHHIRCALYQQSWVNGAPRCNCGLDAIRAALGASL